MSEAVSGHTRGGRCAGGQGTVTRGLEGLTLIVYSVNSQKAKTKW